MAYLSTATTILSYSTNGTLYNTLCPITSYPDLGSAPSKLDTTDLSQSTYKTAILGLQDSPDLTFDANYDEAVFDTILGLTAPDYYLRLSFGTDDGKFDWNGQIRVFAKGGGIDEVRKMSIVLSASTPLVFTTT